MERDRVSVVIDGTIINVNRAKLAENMNGWKLCAKHLGKRPGEPVGATFTPNERHSFDEMAVMTTVVNELRDP